jgi:hypothetical protein
VWRQNKHAENSDFRPMRRGPELAARNAGFAAQRATNHPKTMQHYPRRRSPKAKHGTTNVNHSVTLPVAASDQSHLVRDAPDSDAVAMEVVFGGDPADSPRQVVRRE